MSDHLHVHIPPARFRDEGEPPDGVVEAVRVSPPPKSYTIAPTGETCSLHPRDPLWWVEISTGEEGLWCDRCGTSNLPARPYRQPGTRQRYTWRSFLADLRRLTRRTNDE